MHTTLLLGLTHTTGVTDRWKTKAPTVLISYLACSEDLRVMEEGRQERVVTEILFHVI
jgi:hypothetical protein